MNLENAEYIIKQLKHKNIILVAVSKYQSDYDIRQLIDLGVTNFAENTEQNLKKRTELFPNVNWHFIGRIQSNKIKGITANAGLIHSVSSTKHLEKINQAAKAINKTQNFLIQINITNEQSKSGIAIDEINSFLDYSQTLCNVKCQGFMVIGKHSEDQQVIQKTFEEANILFTRYKNRYNLSILSMGMSNDFELAINSGSTHVRIGSKLFT